MLYYNKVNKDTLTKVLKQNTRILSKLEMIIFDQKEIKKKIDQISETNNNNKDNNNKDISLSQEFIKVYKIIRIKFICIN